MRRSDSASLRTIPCSVIARNFILFVGKSVDIQSLLKTSNACNIIELKLVTFMSFLPHSQHYKKYLSLVTNINYFKFDGQLKTGFGLYLRLTILYPRASLTVHCHKMSLCCTMIHAILSLLPILLILAKLLQK